MSETKRAPAEAPRETPLKTKLIARAIFGLERVLFRTLRLTVVRDDVAQQICKEANGGIMATWHGRTLIPFNIYRGRGYWALISLSRDGELQKEHVELCGFRVIRGSTGRRGVAATRELLNELSKGGVAALTPDGPRGPSEVVQTGVVYMAQKSGKPIIPGGIAAYPCWNVGTWDRFMVPKPFSRAHFEIGEPIYVRPEDDLAEAAEELARQLKVLQERAEQACRPGANSKSA